jgi:hypothetical protein
MDVLRREEREEHLSFTSRESGVGSREGVEKTAFLQKLVYPKRGESKEERAKRLG